jgi:poly(hydroxyalkanoate) depolymerase family esterase
VSLAKNIEFLRHLPKLHEINGLGDFARSMTPGSGGPLVEVTGFGTNPGDLRMFSLVPDSVVPAPAPALVVVLHGCGQTASGYDLGAGWSALAERFGFALLVPEQQRSNNPQSCFNWFNPEDITRDHGEACSIRQMIARMVSDHGIDKRRIFVTGLSAGGAMTAVMLATYPEVFAGGAIIAGLPYGIAGNVREALGGMLQAPSRSAAALGELVRKASPHKGPWPKLSVWHGTSDHTVNPANANEIVKQWLDVHHLPLAPMSKGEVDGYPRQVWWDKDGETIVESYTITNMGHGTPIGIAGDDQHYGAEGAFLIEAGISSSYHIADFFGLTKRIGLPQPAVVEAPKPAAKPVPQAEVPKPVLPAETPKPVVKPLPQVEAPAPAPVARPVPQAETPKPIAKPVAAPIVKPVPKPLPPLVQTPEATAARKPADAPKRPVAPPPPVEPKQRRRIDVGAVITRALTAAGLIK